MLPRPGLKQVLLLDKKPDRKQTVLTEEKLDNIGVRVQTSPRTSLKWLVEEMSVSKTTARNWKRSWMILALELKLHQEYLISG
jgi:hypothetical protein